MGVRVIAEQPQEVQVAVAEAERIVATTKMDRLEAAVSTVEEQGIQNDAGMTQANEILLVIAEGKRIVEDYWAPKVSAAYAVHKMLTAERSKFTKRFDALRERLEKPMKEFRWAQAEEARRRQAEIDRAAEALRKQKLAEARKLTGEGDLAAAAELKAEAKAIVAPVVIMDTPKLEGTSERHPWVVTVDDSVALVQAIASGKVSMEAIKEFNLSWLKRRAAEVNDKATMERMFPGVRVGQDISFAASRK